MTVFITIWVAKNIKCDFNLELTPITQGFCYYIVTFSNIVPLKFDSYMYNISLSELMLCEGIFCQQQ